MYFRRRRRCLAGKREGAAQLSNSLEKLTTASAPERERLNHTLNEAAELKHNIKCTHLCAAFSLKDGEGERLSST